MKNVNQNIPKSWKKLEFDQIAYLNNKKYIPNKNEHLKCLELEHIEKETGRIIGYIDSTEQSSTKNVFKSGDILFGKLRPYLKKFTRPFFDGVCSTEIWVLSATHNCINEYLYQLIQLNSFLSACNVSLGTHMPRADWGFVSHFPFHIPPLPEQEKIAEILGTWDLAIEKLTALIEQKKLLKKGLMQRLLTGKQRLPSFSTPWNKVKLKNICDISKGEQLGRLEMTETGVYPVINGGISKSGLTDSYNREKDTITISEGGNSCGFVAFMKERFWCGGHCYALSNLQTNLHFLFQILKSKESDIMKLRVGSGLPNIQKSSLDAFSLHIPTDISEQKAIADILSKADEEIDLLTRKLSALKEQKTGLMQKLLTGQIRVKAA